MAMPKAGKTATGISNQEGITQGNKFGSAFMSKGQVDPNGYSSAGASSLEKLDMKDDSIANQEKITEGNKWGTGVISGLKTPRGEYGKSGSTSTMSKKVPINTLTRLEGERPVSDETINNKYFDEMNKG